MPTIVLVLALTCGADRGIADMRADVATLARPGATDAQRRAAWQNVVADGPDALPLLLGAMNTDDVVALNWLRTAFDRVLGARAKAGGEIDTDFLSRFAADAGNHGRARRFALETLERLRPGSSAKLVAGRLDDPEFRYDAVELLLADAARQAEAGEKARALDSYKKALESSRDVRQARRAAAGLLDLGAGSSLARHFGFLTDWYVVGPFDAGGKKGFTTVYPPEKKVDLAAGYDGKAGQVRWKRYTAEEIPPRVNSRHVVLVNLREAKALGDAVDAVAFAYTEITVPEAVDVEFRGAADDNFTVWVNGEKAFGFEEYSNGVRHDRHRFRVHLRKGENTVLVKVCQSPPYIAPNWEFFLRVCDDTGKGVPFEHTLP